MNNEVAISVENLSKAYRLGLREQRPETLTGAITSLVRSPFRNYSDLRKLTRFKGSEVNNGRSKINQSSPEDVIWALRDISFEVKHGEVLGIIGRNGAGKSTLLKILSRITDPTHGRATIYGRVGSLLEVGTGFHPDLTGRENVYLNGTILGMRKTEVDKKFDEIVAFAGVEKFIDTPVKRYSSGMGVRLAFAVAAHLEPEILIVDEVLAVGDLSFQEKCLGKMAEVTRLGRTVLLVSHNIGAIKNLCRNAILLSDGCIAASGEVDNVISSYLTSLRRVEVTDGNEANQSKVSLEDIRISNGSHAAISTDEPFEVCVTLRTGQPLLNYDLYCMLRDQTGNFIVHSRSNDRTLGQTVKEGTHEIKVQFPPMWLTPGVYTVEFKLLPLTKSLQRRYFSGPLLLEITGSANASDRLGMLTPRATWALETEESTAQLCVAK